MAGRTFLDTNILVYLVDGGHPAKQAAARRAFDELEPGSVVLSTQVLQEFHWNATRKLVPPMPTAAAARFVLDLSAHRVVTVDVPLILAAISRTTSDPVDFWDALILEAALEAGCDRLYSEDFQHGRLFGALQVVNPLRASARGSG